MAEIKRLSTELQVKDKLLDTSGDAGTSGQILSSTGTGTNWINSTAFTGGTVANATTFSALGTFNNDILANGHIYGRSVDGQSSRLYRFGGVYLTWDSDSYGTNDHHSLRSTYGNSFTDSITLNSYNHIRFNIDSNNNNSTSYFEVGDGVTDTSNVIFRLDQAGDVTITGDITVSGGDIVLGGDVNLYRDGANILRTDDAFHANGHIHVGGASGGGNIYNRSDTSNYIAFSSNAITFSKNATFTGTVTWSGGSSTNANTAYGWGNHASAGYLTSSSTQSKYLRSDASDTGTGTITLADSSTADNPLILGSSSQTSYTLQQWQTSAHGTNEAYIIAYGAGHGSQAGNFAMKNIESGGEIFFELAAGVEPLRMTSTGSTFAGSIRTTADIGRDDHNRIMFSTDNSLIFRVADTHRFRMDSNNFSPYADSSYDLGTSSLYFRHGYIDAITTTGDVTVGGDITVAGNLNITGDINSVSVTDLDVTDKTITVGVGQTAANSGSSGILISRSDSTDPSMLWNQSTSRFDFNSGLTVTGQIHTTGSVYAKGSLFVIDTNGTNNHIQARSNGTEGFLTVSNGSNWGFIVRGPSNDPRIGAWYGGTLKIEGFHSSDGATGSNAIDFAQFQFGNDHFQMNAATSTFAGGVTINSNSFSLNGTAPTMTVNSSNNASGFRINVTGLDANGDDLFRAQDSGTTRFTIKRNGDANFLGDVTMTQTSGNNILYINSSGGGAPVIYFEDSNRKWGQFVSNGHLYFKDETANVTSLKIDGATALATFAGVINTVDGNATTPAYNFTSHDGNGMYLEEYDASNNKEQVSIATDGVRRFRANEAGIWSDQNVYFTGSLRKFGAWQATSGTAGEGFSFQNTADSTTPLSLTSAGNASFAGIVSVPTGKAFRMYNAAGSGWGEITLEETENKLQFNRGIKPSGNEQSDQTLGTSTKRWHTVYAHDGNFSGDVRADNIGLGAAAASFGSGVPTLFFKGTSSTNGRAGALYFKENDGTECAALYVTDGNDGYGTVLTAYQGSLKLATGSLTGTVLTLDQSNNATFAGNVTLESASPVLKIDATGTGNPEIFFTRITGDDQNAKIRLLGNQLAFENEGDPDSTFLFQGRAAGAGSLSDFLKIEDTGITAPGATFTGNVNVFPNASTGTFRVGRYAGQEFKLHSTDLTNTLTSINDADENQTHDFILNREHAGSGANNFKIQKDGTDQLSIDTNANATFAGRILNTYTGTSTHQLKNGTSNGTILELITSGDGRTMYFQSDHIWSSGSFYLGNNSYNTIFRGNTYSFENGNATFAGNIVLDDGSGASPTITFRNGADEEWYLSENSSGKLIIQQSTTERGEWSSTGLVIKNGALSITGDGSNAATLEEHHDGAFDIRAVSDFTIDAAGDIILDAGGGDITLKDDSTQFARFTKSGDDFHIVATRSDGDIKFFGSDGGSSVTALRLDMSDAGWAHFNTGIAVGNSSATSTFAGNVTISGDLNITGDIADRDIPCIINTGWGDDSSTTSSILVPLGNTVDDVSIGAKDGEHTFVAPYAGKIVKIIMKNTNGTLSSSFTTELKYYKNGSSAATSGELTASSSAITWSPTSSNTFAAGDEINILYQKSAGSKYWREVSMTIVIELTDYDI